MSSLKVSNSPGSAPAYPGTYNLNKNLKNRGCAHVVMAAATSFLSSESLCVLLLIYLRLAHFPNSELKLNRKVFQHELLFVSKTTSRPDIQGFMTPTPISLS